MNHSSLYIDFYEAIALDFVDISKMFTVINPHKSVTMETDKVKLGKWSNKKILNAMFEFCVSFVLFALSSMLEAKKKRQKQSDIDQTKIITSHAMIA